MALRVLAVAVSTVCACLFAAVGQAAAQSTPFPSPIGPMELFERLERRAPGALDLVSWHEIERCMDRAEARVFAELWPLVAELDRIATAQSWLNWPSIKPGPVRRLRDRCIDLELQIERALVRCAIDGVRTLRTGATESGAAAGAAAGDGNAADEAPAADAFAESALVRALEGVEHARIRELLPPWLLLDAATVDLEGMVQRVLARESIDDATRRTIRAALDAWERARAAECLAQRDLRREAFDRLEQRLAALGVDLADLDDPNGAWMVRAFDAWEEVGAELERSVRGTIERDRRTMAEIAQALPSRSAAAWIDAVLARSHRLSGQDNRAFAGDEFARAARVRDLSPELRERMADARDRWSTADATVVRRWCEALVDDSPLHCPLTYAHWGPERRYAGFDDRRRELDHERIELANSAIAELRGMLGASASVLEVGVADDDPRLEALPPVEAGPGWRNPNDEGWSHRPDARVFTRSPQGTGWLDPGPIGERDFERLLCWFDLGEDATRSLSMLRRDRAEEFDERWTMAVEAPPHGVQPVTSGWRFEQSKYRYDPGLADRILARSLDRAVALGAMERELFQAAIALCSNDAQRRRVRLAATARCMELRLEPLRAALVEQAFDRRGETPIPSAMLAECLRAFEASARETAPARAAAPSREAEDRLLRATDDRLDALAALVEERLENASAAAIQLLRLRDEAMWSAGTLRPAVERGITRLRGADDPARARLVEAQESMIEGMRDAAHEGGDRARACVRAWQASAFPLVHAREPSALAAIERDAARPSPLQGEFERLRAWHASLDEPLAEEAVAVCIEARRAEGIVAPAAADRAYARLERIGDRRRTAGERAEIRRRLLWRSAGVEIEPADSDE